MRVTFISAIAILLCSAHGWADESAAIRKSAKAGDADAQLALGRYFADEARGARSERSAQRHWKQALEWYSKAAEQGFAQAQYELGAVYLVGDGIEKNEELGVAWLIKAAEQDLPAAQFEIGNLYLAGVNMEKDPGLGLDMLRKSANQLYVPAQKQLGTMYFQGSGVDRNLVQAHLWFTVAALSDDKTALRYLPTLESIMDEAQIEEARRLAAEWRAEYLAE